MNKVLPSFLLCIFIFSDSSAQDFKITGNVVDALSKQPLESTTIYAESPRDSSLVVYSISDEDGFFELEDRSDLNELNLFFSFNGYKTLSMRISLKALVKLGNIPMEEQAQELKGVSLVGERVPIVIKKDTMEFNADSFKTRPDATVEEVLKKLPGVQVDNDGKITVNGKEVNKVLVNGQVFFSTDPKVATKSLPKEVIDKIQITDTKTKTQEFTGEEGDGENKTINLTIKKDKNKGYIGRIAAGYGTDDRYQTNGLLNYFNDTERISFIASANNINNSGFSFDEIYDMVGNTRGGYNGARESGLINNFGNGITTSSNIGGSYANAKKGASEIDANYFFGYSDSFNDQKTSRENLLPDRRFFSENESNFVGSTNSNRGAANLEFDIDSTLRISVEPSMSVNRTDSKRFNTSATTNDDGELINRNNRTRAEDGFQRNFSNRFNIIKKLDTIGKFVSLSFSNNNTENNSTSLLNSLREIFGDTPEEQLLDQRSEVNNKRNSYEMEMEYRQPLVNKWFLDLGYTYNNDDRDNTKDVMDFDQTSNGYTLFNEELSSDFNFKSEQHTPSMGIRRRGEKLSIRFDASYAFTNLNNRDFLQNTSFSRSYENLLFRGRLRYSLGKNKRFYIRYNKRLDLPSINQLQPVPNVNDPLNIVIGNPDLSPAVEHGINFNYDDYDWKERTGIYVYSNIDFQKNRVSAVSTTDENLLRTTRYTNVDGNYNGYAGFGYSREIKKDSTFSATFNLRPGLNFGQQVSFTNGTELKAKSFDVSPSFSTTLSFRELVEFEPGYGISFNSTKYNLDTIEDVKYTSQNLNLRLTTYWPENLVWGNDIRYTYNGNVGPGFRKDALFWNMSLGLEIFNKKAIVKVLAYDLLNQNTNVRRTTGEDFIQDFQGTVLQRYFMGSFTYKFDQFGGKKDRGSRFRRN
ncbi:Outer membrane protein beta-barrel family protein [Pricia antarctica]|uniref:Outer membrane protein beta-barrel family protein n=1 Tax=Pricia antarctica TaxID=641691 RepID=A0A1G7IPE8_9FLAO|nr:outer membrane beta-barrel protein [Pricia antarctica]SDF14485.1 Outer membrane protein beta-barrel family protein [Pricia antarctica]